MKTVGILALQGDFDAHRKALAEVGAQPQLVRNAQQLSEVDGLILPGGESTTMLNLLKSQDLLDALQRFGKSRPIFGTCAGVILLCTTVHNPAQESLGLMDLTVERNGYGRQIDSSIDYIRFTKEFSDGADAKPLEAVFIRAPVIQSVGPEVKVLAEHLGSPVLVEQNGHLGATFHPELSGDSRIHRLFVSKL